METETLYEAIGGQPTIDKIVNYLYDYVSEHPDLIPIFPKDFTETRHKQRLFLTQFLGGPPLYLQERGHPMLRRRHLEFAVTPERREAWLECAHKAMVKTGVEEPYFTEIYTRLSMTASHMVNSDN